MPTRSPTVADSPRLTPEAGNSTIDARNLTTDACFQSIYSSSFIPFATSHTFFATYDGSFASYHTISATSHTISASYDSIFATYHTTFSTPYTIFASYVTSYSTLHTISAASCTSRPDSQGESGFPNPSPPSVEHQRFIDPVRSRHSEDRALFHKGSSASLTTTTTSNQHTPRCLLPPPLSSRPFARGRFIHFDRPSTFPRLKLS